MWKAPWKKWCFLRFFYWSVYFLFPSYEIFPFCVVFYWNLYILLKSRFSFDIRLKVVFSLCLFKFLLSSTLLLKSLLSLSFLFQCYLSIKFLAEMFPFFFLLKCLHSFFFPIEMCTLSHFSIENLLSFFWHHIFFSILWQVLLSRYYLCIEVFTFSLFVIEIITFSVFFFRNFDFPFSFGNLYSLCICLLIFLLSLNFSINLKSLLAFHFPLETICGPRPLGSHHTLSP